MSNATPGEIDAFLNECRKVVDSSFFLLTTKPKNKQTIIELGYTHENVKDEIKTLSVGDYSEGPKQDRNSTDKEWIFGKFICGREIYINIMLSRFDDPGNLIPTLYCWSFHFAGRCLHYPYKK